MKKIFLFILYISLILPMTQATVYADHKNIIAESVDRIVAEKDRSGLEVLGYVPLLKNTNSPTVQGIINEKVRSFVKNTVSTAKKSQYARKVNFNYEDTSYGNIVSCSIMASVTSSTTRNYKMAFTVDLNTTKILSLEDILNSKNATAIINTIINNSIAADPDKYTITDKNPLDPQNFYVENNNAKLVYNNYTFPIMLGSITDYTLDKYYYSKETFDLKMIPLRAVCEKFGYTLSYNTPTKEIKIKKGDFETSLRVGQNVYYTNFKLQRTLDASPELSNNITYVPISFFEQILGIYYKIEDGKITFSQYIDGTVTP